MLIYLIFIFVSETTSINSTQVPYVDLQKCCESGRVFEQEAGNLFCNDSENGRAVIQTLLDSDFNNTNEYQCVETLKSDLILFRRTLNATVAVKNISDAMLPKCCPVNYKYNPSTHSCAEHFGHNIFNTTFLKIGLPECQIIYDHFFERISDFLVDNNYIPKLGYQFGDNKYCVDQTVSDNYVVRECKNFDICKTVLCLHKCCPDGQSFVNGSHCKDTYSYGMDLTRFSNFISNTSNTEYAIVHGYKTKVYIPKVKNYHLDDQGNFHSSEEKFGNEIYSPEEETYCIEHATKNGIVYGHTLFRIFPELGIDYIQTKFLFNRWAMVVSNIFLVVTVLYYIFSKEMKKVFGKTLVSFCSALFTLFTIIIYCTFNADLNARITTCKIIGFVLVYFSFCCFVWLQVMCYDIYWTFGSSKRYSSFTNKKQRDLKRFMCYSIYGWGVPLVITFILLTFHFVNFLPPSIEIKMGEKKCLIEKGDDNYAEILFYIIPLTLIQSVNVVFFVKTVKYCLQVKGNIQKMNESVDIQKKQNKFRARKERFGLVIKLSFVMGVFYLFEVASSFYDFKKNVITEHVEIIWDFINCLQGLFIFFIFVCKTKYLKMCRCRKAAMERIRKISLTTTSTKLTGSSERKLSRDSRRKCSKDEANNKFS